MRRAQLPKGTDSQSDAQDGLLLSCSVAKSRRRASNDGEQDGGMFALAGFVNQMLGSAEDFVRCISPPESSQTLISFETEASGQDTKRTSVTAKGRRVLVLTQYKFSLNPKNNSIGPTELKEIAATLKKTERACN